ncbi:hypothetical protein A616_27485 [Brevibacillus brevis X23]|nr:hypothetical protein A616_27485 [Brevibacillus brevis X23]
MFSSRLYPLFVRAVSFQTCDRTFEQLWLHLIFQKFVMVFQEVLIELAFSEFNKSHVGRSEFPVKRLWSPT